MAKANRPHFHIWLQAKGGKIFYKLAKGYHTRQAAGQAGKRRQPDPEKRMVIQCDREECRPKL